MMENIINQCCMATSDRLSQVGDYLASCRKGPHVNTCQLLQVCDFTGGPGNYRAIVTK